MNKETKSIEVEIFAGNGMSLIKEVEVPVDLNGEQLTAYLRDKDHPIQVLLRKHSVDWQIEPKMKKETRSIEVEFMAKREIEFSTTRDIEVPADLNDDQLADYLQNYADGIEEGAWEEQDDTGIYYDDFCVNWDEGEDPQWSGRLILSFDS